MISVEPNHLAWARRVDGLDDRPSDATPAPGGSRRFARSAGAVRAWSRSVARPSDPCWAELSFIGAEKNRYDLYNTSLRTRSYFAPLSI